MPDDTTAPPRRRRRGRARRTAWPLLLAGFLAAGCSGSASDDGGGDTGGAPDGEEVTGAGANAGPAPVYGDGWSAVHADAANTDYARVDGPADVTLAWERSFDGTINLRATISPSGRLHVTSTSPGCHLHVLDAATRETVWCSDEVGRLAVISSPLLDQDGHIYLADAEAMHAFDPDGGLLWQSPIVGVPLSAQFTPGGDVAFITNIGHITCSTGPRAPRSWRPTSSFPARPSTPPAA